MEYNLNYIRILTDDFKKLYEFYAEVLGMKPRFNTPEGPYEEFEIQGSILSIYERKLMMQVAKSRHFPIPETPNDNIAMIFAVHDIDSLYHGLKEKIEFVTAPTDRPDWSIRTAHIRDPDGNLIEFNQPLTEV